MSVKKALISEQEWIKLRIREGSQLPRDRVPHCFGIPVLTLPQCNHLVGNGQNRDLCSLRHSCALAYAERMKLDVGKVYSGQNDTQYPALVSMIQEEERRIKYVPRIGKAVEVAPSQADEVVEEVTMASIESPVVKRAAPKVKSIGAAIPLRELILGFLRERDWVARKEVHEYMEAKLNRKPLNHAVSHKIGLVFLPKHQEKFGYRIEKESRKIDGRVVFYYKLTGEQSVHAKSET
jgi:hypothetical protein